MRAVRQSLTWALLVLLSALPGVAGLATPESSSHRRLTVVVCSGLTIRSLRGPDMPALRRLCATGAVGLVSAPLPRPATEFMAALVAASGLEEQSAPTVPPPTPLSAHGARATFVRRMGHQPPRTGSFIPNWALLEEQGWTQRFAGVRATSYPFHVPASSGPATPSAAALAADGDGVIDTSPPTPRGVVVVDTGSDSVVLDRTVREAMACSSTVIVCTLWSGRLPEPRSEYLGLAVLWGKGAARGVLSSATTRTPGLVALTDLGPTVIAILGATPGPGTTGTPWQTQPALSPVSDLAALDSLVTTNRCATVPLLAGIGVVLGLAVLVGLVGVAAGRKSASGAGWLVLWCMQMPAGLILTEALLGFATRSGIALADWSATGTALVVMTLLTVLIAAGARQPGAPSADRALLATIRLMVGAIALDGLFGFRLAGLTPLSAFQLAGTRYYGIGNEYSGILIGATILWSQVEIAPRMATMASLAAIAVLVAHPALGADAGGTIAATAGFGAVVIVMSGHRLTVRSVAALVVAGLAAAISVAWLDRLSGHPSHIGAAAGSAQAHGLATVAAIARRKVIMNLGLAVHPITLAALAGVATTLTLVAKRHVARMHRLAQLHPAWPRHLAPLALATAVGVVLNDSGVVFGLFSGGIALVSGLWLLLADPAECRNM